MSGRAQRDLSPQAQRSKTRTKPATERSEGGGAL